LIERFADWNWSELSRNSGVEWNISLLEYADQHELPVKWGELNAAAFFQSISPETLIALGKSK